MSPLFNDSHSDGTAPLSARIPVQKLGHISDKEPVIRGIVIN